MFRKIAKSFGYKPLQSLAAPKSELGMINPGTSNNPGMSDVEALKHEIRKYHNAPYANPGVEIKNPTIDAKATAFTKIKNLIRPRYGGGSNL